MPLPSLAELHAQSPVGFIGLGVMGRGMARRLLGQGHPLAVFARDAQVRTQFATLGAHVADSPRAVGAGCALVFLCLPDGGVVEQVLFGSEGLAAGLAPGSCVVDTSTIAPAQAQDFAARLSARGLHFLDAPVSGGQAGAELGTLSCMVGGDAAVLQACRVPISAFAKNIFHAGASGAGQAVKACNQVAVSAAMLGICEALVLARTHGVAPERMRDILLAGSARSTALERHALRAIEGHFTPGFRTALMRKDLSLALDAARAHGARLPGTETVAGLLDDLAAQDRDEWDWVALAPHLQALAGLDVPDRIEP